MYTVGIEREFFAQHYLVGADFGAENQPHTHAYRVEFRLSGDGLDRHGFLADIDAMSAALDEVLDGVHDRTLNDLPAFEGLNPSIEHLARILCRALRPRFCDGRLRRITVTIRESPHAWAAYTEPL